VNNVESNTSRCFCSSLTGLKIAEILISKHAYHLQNVIDLFKKSNLFVVLSLDLMFLVVRVLVLLQKLIVLLIHHIVVQVFHIVQYISVHYLLIFENRKKIISLVYLLIP
jgi:hypothetical protein